MYEYIKGRYIGINKDYIIVENNGIGYKIFTSGATMAEMPKVNEEIMLYLEQIVREDFIGLYGFKDREELEMFKLFRAPGIGKKTAGRIILELKDKIKTEEVTQGVDIQEGFEDIIPNNANSVEEALGALLALGYSEKEAENTLKKVNKHESVENIIKECLRVLMG